MNKIHLAAWFGFFFVASGAMAGEAPFEQRLESTLRASLPRMGCNLSPTTAKPVERNIDGQRKIVNLVPVRGSIVASPSLRDPDYYFHWVRDSSLVVDALVRLLPLWQSGGQGDELQAFLADFIYLSRDLQSSTSPYGLAEVRFNVDGSVDDVFWSRPQLDGPALRALSLMRYLKSFGKTLDPAVASAARGVILRDLNFVAGAYERKGYDLWEYSYGHHFYTRLVQLGALELGKEFMSLDATPEWSAAIDLLTGEAREHWDAAGGFYHFSSGPVVDNQGHSIGEVGQGKDASVVLAAIHSGRTGPELSLLDPRLMQTVWKLEQYFRESFPYNRGRALGPAIGRHPGDNYYGGNAWYFLTAGYAEFYYKLAKAVGENRQALVVVPENRAPLEHALGEDLPLGTDLTRDPALRERAAARLVAKGDAFMATMMDSIGADGNMAEQFSKVDGVPVSAGDLTWSYAGFLSAALARESARASAISYSQLSLGCARH